MGGRSCPSETGYLATHVSVTMLDRARDTAATLLVSIAERLSELRAMDDAEDPQPFYERWYACLWDGFLALKEAYEPSVRKVILRGNPGEAGSALKDAVPELSGGTAHEYVAKLLLVYLEMPSSYAKTVKRGRSPRSLPTWYLNLEGSKWWPRGMKVRPLPEEELGPFHDALRLAHLKHPSVERLDGLLHGLDIEHAAAVNWLEELRARGGQEDEPVIGVAERLGVRRWDQLAASVDLEQGINFWRRGRSQKRVSLTWQDLKIGVGTKQGKLLVYLAGAVDSSIKAKTGERHRQLLYTVNKKLRKAVGLEGNPIFTNGGRWLCRFPLRTAGDDDRRPPGEVTLAPEDEAWARAALTGRD